MTPTMLRGDSPYARHSASRWPDVVYRSGSDGVCNSRADWLRTTAGSQAGPTKRCCCSIAATVLRPRGHRASHAAQPEFLLVTFLCAQRKVTRLSGRDPTFHKLFAAMPNSSCFDLKNNQFGMEGSGGLDRLEDGDQIPRGGPDGIEGAGDVADAHAFLQHDQASLLFLELD